MTDLSSIVRPSSVQDGAGDVSSSGEHIRTPRLLGSNLNDSVTGYSPGLSSVGCSMGASSMPPSSLDGGATTDHPGAAMMIPPPIPSFISSAHPQNQSLSALYSSGGSPGMLPPHQLSQGYHPGHLPPPHPQWQQHHGGGAPLMYAHGGFRPPPSGGMYCDPSGRFPPLQSNGLPMPGPPFHPMQMMPPGSDPGMLLPPHIHSGMDGLVGAYGGLHHSMGLPGSAMIDGMGGPVQQSIMNGPPGDMNGAGATTPVPTGSNGSSSAVNGSGGSGGKSGGGRGRSLCKFTELQKTEMENLYQQIPYPSSGEKTKLAEHVGLSYDQVQRWFEGRRKKQRVIDQKEGKEPIFHPATKHRKMSHLAEQKAPPSPPLNEEDIPPDVPSNFSDSEPPDGQNQLMVAGGYSQYDPSSPPLPQNAYQWPPGVPGNYQPFPPMNGGLERGMEDGLPHRTDGMIMMMSQQEKLLGMPTLGGGGLSATQLPGMFGHPGLDTGMVPLSTAPPGGPSAITVGNNNNNGGWNLGSSVAGNVDDQGGRSMVHPQQFQPSETFQQHPRTMQLNFPSSTHHQLLSMPSDEGSDRYYHGDFGPPAPTALLPGPSVHSTAPSDHSGQGISGKQTSQAPAVGGDSNSSYASSRGSMTGPGFDGSGASASAKNLSLGVAQPNLSFDEPTSQPQLSGMYEGNRCVGIGGNVRGDGYHANPSFAINTAGIEVSNYGYSEGLGSVPNKSYPERPQNFGSSKDCADDGTSAALRPCAVGDNRLLDHKGSVLQQQNGLGFPLNNCVPIDHKVSSAMNPNSSSWSSGGAAPNVPPAQPPKKQSKSNKKTNGAKKQVPTSNKPIEHVPSATTSNDDNFIERSVSNPMDNNSWGTIDSSSYFTAGAPPPLASPPKKHSNPSNPAGINGAKNKSPKAKKTPPAKPTTPRKRNRAVNNVKSATAASVDGHNAAADGQTGLMQIISSNPLSYDSNAKLSAGLMASGNSSATQAAGLVEPPMAQHLTNRADMDVNIPPGQLHSGYPNMSVHSSATNSDSFDGHRYSSATFNPPPLSVAPPSALGYPPSQVYDAGIPVSSAPTCESSKAFSSNNSYFAVASIAGSSNSYGLPFDNPSQMLPTPTPSSSCLTASSSASYSSHSTGFQAYTSSSTAPFSMISTSAVTPVVSESGDVSANILDKVHGCTAAGNRPETFAAQWDKDIPKEEDRNDLSPRSQQVGAETTEMNSATTHDVSPAANCAKIGGAGRGQEGDESRTETPKCTYSSPTRSHNSNEAGSPGNNDAHKQSCLETMERDGERGSLVENKPLSTNSAEPIPPPPEPSAEAMAALYRRWQASNSGIQDGSECPPSFLPPPLPAAGILNSLMRSYSPSVATGAGLGTKCAANSPHYPLLPSWPNGIGPGLPPGGPPIPGWMMGRGMSSSPFSGFVDGRTWSPIPSHPTAGSPIHLLQRPGMEAVLGGPAGPMLIAGGHAMSADGGSPFSGVSTSTSSSDCISAPSSSIGTQMGVSAPPGVTSLAASTPTPTSSAYHQFTSFLPLGSRFSLSRTSSPSIVVPTPVIPSPAGFLPFNSIPGQEGGGSVMSGGSPAPTSQHMLSRLGQQQPLSVAASGVSYSPLPTMQAKFGGESPGSVSVGPSPFLSGLGSQSCGFRVEDYHLSLAAGKRNGSGVAMDDTPVYTQL